MGMSVHCGGPRHIPGLRLPQRRVRERRKRRPHVKDVSVSRREEPGEGTREPLPSISRRRSKDLRLPVGDGPP